MPIVLATLDQCDPALASTASTARARVARASSGWQAAGANLVPNSALKVNRNRPGRAPLLLMVGTEDRIAAPAIVKATAKVYRRSTSVTEYRAFAGRSHIIAAEAGWEEVADAALDWAVNHA